MPSKSIWFVGVCQLMAQLLLLRCTPVITRPFHISVPLSHHLVFVYLTSQGRAALSLAAYSGQTGIIKALIEAGSDVEDKNIVSGPDQDARRDKAVEHRNSKSGQYSM
jgi:hypothetical protein